MIAIMLVIATVVLALFSFLMKTAISRIGTAMATSMHARHKAAEYILERGRIPPAWIEDWRNDRKKKTILNTGDTLGECELLRAFATKRLAVLIRYFKRACVFEDDFVRKKLVDDLCRVSEQWMTSKAQDLVGEAADADHMDE